jgi:serine/threonine-protein kinase
VDPFLGRVLDGRFRLLELVAKGGMGRVYRAVQSPLGREVAVKILDLSASVDDDGQFRSRFFREASICARLTHPNTVRIFDYGQDDDVYYLVMELLEGQTLSHLIKREGPLEPRRAVALCRQILASLSQAHDMGVIHRDMKPANVFVIKHGDEEFIKVLDFGLVKPLEQATQVTQAGDMLGSPSYMAPEQILGEAIHRSTDVYAVGICLFGMLTRDLPFRRDHPLAVLNAHVSAAPPDLRTAFPDLDIPPSLAWVVARCLEKKPHDRFATTQDFSRALSRVKRELDGGAPALPMTLVRGTLAADDLDPETQEIPASSLQPAAPFDGPTQPTLARSAQHEAAKDFTLAAGAAALVALVLLGGLGVALTLWITNPAADTPVTPAPVEAATVVEPPPDPVAAEPAGAAQPVAEDVTPAPEPAAVQSKPASAPSGSAAVTEPVPSDGASSEPTPAQPATEPAAEEPTAAEPATAPQTNEVRDPWAP